MNKVILFQLTVIIIVVMTILNIQFVGISYQWIYVNHNDNTGFLRQQMKLTMINGTSNPNTSSQEMLGPAADVPKESTRALFLQSILPSMLSVSSSPISVSFSPNTQPPSVRLSLKHSPLKQTSDPPRLPTGKPSSSTPLPEKSSSKLVDFHTTTSITMQPPQGSPLNETSKPPSPRAISLPTSISPPQESLPGSVASSVKQASQTPAQLIIMIISSNPKPNIYPYTLYTPGEVTPEKCPSESNCFITHDIYDREYKNHTDVFIIQRPYTLALLDELTTKHPNSSLVFMNQESPFNTLEHFGPEFDNRFTFTATYQRDSDIVTPYHDVLPLPPDNEITKLTDYAKNKTELIVTFMSNCVSYRMLFINSLNGHIPVSLFGGCQSDHSKKCARFDPQCEDYQRTFKFYLALENSFCTDYVTEKLYFQGLEQGLVPVVLNRGKLDDPTVAPPKSFINILDFNSTKELADYLLYLDKNNTAYNEYHQWRQNYVVKEHDYVCNTCKRLWELKREGRFGKSTVKLGEYYSVDRNCVSFDHDDFMKYLT